MNIRGFQSESTMVLIMACSLIIAGCSKTASIIEINESDVVYSKLAETPDWSKATHGKLASDKMITNLDRIFDTTSVQTLRIVIEPKNWALMNNDLNNLKAKLGSTKEFSRLDSTIFVPSKLLYYSDKDDSWTEWYKVGIRFKGNSSLFDAKSKKLPFKLDFDEFEDQYPAIKNQRFYGFKQLNLKNNHKDQSLLHEVVANDLFRDMGLASAHASFYRLYLNVDGSNDPSNDTFYGLYTLVEELDDSVIKTQYSGNDGGNLYKPEDDAATFASGSYHQEEYGLKTKHDKSYADIKGLYEAINSPLRTTNNAAWKAQLETIFDLDTFLKWLATNSVIQNWDTYGVMPHNFFLYHNPNSGKFDWIPWDNNESLQYHPRGLSIDLASVDADAWPLIGYILAQDEYKKIYQAYLKHVSDAYFNGNDSTRYNINNAFRQYEALLKEFIEAEGSEYSSTSPRQFANAVDKLIANSQDRYNAVNDYID